MQGSSFQLTLLSGVPLDPVYNVGEIDSLGNQNTRIGILGCSRVRGQNFVLPQTVTLRYPGGGGEFSRRDVSY